MASKNLEAEQESEGDAAELSPAQLVAREELYKLAAEQGVRPLTMEDLEAMGGVWPEDEDIEDFLAAWREWRGERSRRIEP